MLHRPVGAVMHPGKTTSLTNDIYLTRIIMKKTLGYSTISIAIAGIIGLSGCGGGGGGGATSSGVSTSGVITGFGSIFVDGIEFETSNSSFSLDDGDDGQETEDELEIGMVVTVTGTVNPGGTTGVATHVEYDDVLEGVILSSNLSPDGTGTMDIMGQSVTVDTTTIFESHVAGITAIEQLAAGNVVEVSGYSSGDGSIFATRIELKSAIHSGQEIEVKGLVSNLTAATFEIGSLVVDYSGATLEVPGGMLQVDLYVEVKSTAGIDPQTGHLLASEVELEEDGDMDFDGDEGDNVGIKGIVTAVNSQSEFEIDGRRIIITGTTEFEHGDASDITTGVRIEAEGSLDDSGAMLAREIQFEEDSNIEMQGTLEAVSGTGLDGTVTVFGQTITVTRETIMIDDRDQAPEHYFSLDDLAPVHDYLEIDLHRDPVSGELIADKLERDDDSGSAELEGPVEDILSPGLQPVIAGITVDIDGVTRLPSYNTGTELKVKGTYDQGTMVFTASSVELDD